MDIISKLTFTSFVIFSLIIILFFIAVSLLRKKKSKKDDHQKYDKWKDEFNLYDNFKNVKRPEILWSGNEISIESKREIQNYFVHLENEVSKKISFLKEVEKDYLSQIADALTNRNDVKHTHLLQGYPNFKKHLSDIQREYKTTRDGYTQFLRETPITKDVYEKSQKDFFNAIFRNIKQKKDYSQKSIEPENVNNTSEIRAREQIEEKKSREQEAQRQKEEFLKKLQDDQRKALERLLYNRQLKLMEIKSADCFGGTYIIRNNINNNLYVGSSENLYKRIIIHLTNLKSGKHHSYKLQEEFNQFGNSVFSFFLIQSIPFLEWSEKGFIKSLPAEDKKKKYKLHLKSEESTLIRLLQPFYNIETDTRGSRHWKDNDKYSGYRSLD